MKKMTKKGKKGFTLIELVVVIAILGILAAILIPVIGGFIERANKSADEANARGFFNAVAMHYAVAEDGVAWNDGTNGIQDLFGPIPSEGSVSLSGSVVQAVKWEGDADGFVVYDNQGNFYWNSEEGYTFSS